MWGQFPEVKHPLPRGYVRAYWRFLLGWCQPPPPPPLPPRTLRYLRLMARDEVFRYRASIVGGRATVYSFQPPYEPPPKKAA
jgi:hypothetical protein